MRIHLALIVLCAGIVLLALARADTPPRHAREEWAKKEPFGFDHAIHARDVAKKQQPAVACARCHAMKAGGLAKPGHAACFEGCHQTNPREPVAEGKMLFCNPCHSEAALANPKATKALAVAYPPYELAPDHARRFGHKSHAQLPCAQCHDKRYPPHRRCAGCHDGSTGRAKSFAMATCENCHPAATGAAAGPPKLLRKPQQLVVTSAFSHARHATRGAARQCVTCHAPVTTTDDRALPRPTVETCAVAGCHDGTASFGVTAACTKCHKDVPADFKVNRREDRFTHATHEKLAIGACTSCHPLGKTEVLVAGHGPCAGCHAKEFGERDPKVWICSACHNGSEPWRQLVADRHPPDTTEFGVSLDHGKHSQACGVCHSLVTETSELRPPRGHAACTTTGCHALKGGPAPQLGTCEGCHVRGLDDARDVARRTARWSVRATFVHGPHRREKDGKDLACVSCHTDMSAKKVLDLATPAKATCARCHNGDDAFKLTGTRCLRCHGVGR